MAFTPVPLPFRVRGKIEGDQVVFLDDVTVPVTYLSVEHLFRHPLKKPPDSSKKTKSQASEVCLDSKLGLLLRTAVREGLTEAERAAGFDRLTLHPWSITDAGVLPNEDLPPDAKNKGLRPPVERRLLLLKLIGSKITQAAREADSEYNRLYRALLEQGTVQLSLEIADPGYPEGLAIVPLFVKFEVQYCG